MITHEEYLKAQKVVECYELQLKQPDVISWVDARKIPDNVDNYLVYGNGMYTVTFYSHRRKKWNTDQIVEYYAKLPDKPCL
jgi:hypothetical protein